MMISEGLKRNSTLTELNLYSDEKEERKWKKRKKNNNESGK